MKKEFDNYQECVMNTEKVKYLLNFIDRTDVIVVDDSPYLHSVTVSEITGKEDNEVLRMNWVDDEQEFSVIFTEIGLSNAIMSSDHLISLYDHEGSQSVIRLYSLVPLKIEEEF